MIMKKTAIYTKGIITMNKFLGHLHTINKHRFLVFKLSIKAGIPIRGLMHDLSKYSLVEFTEGVKYYTDGMKSTISTCKKLNGYSNSWLHHKGRNKHHFEYWYDFNAPIKASIIPYKYFVELICDNIAASLTYNKNNWNNSNPLNYFLNRKDLDYINDDIKKVIIEIYTHLKDFGINNTINKKYLKKTYNKYIK